MTTFSFSVILRQRREPRRSQPRCEFSQPHPPHRDRPRRNFSPIEVIDDVIKILRTSEQPKTDVQQRLQLVDKELSLLTGEEEQEARAEIARRLQSNLVESRFSLSPVLLLQRGRLISVSPKVEGVIDKIAAVVEDTFNFTPDDMRMIAGFNSIIAVGLLYCLGCPQTVYDLGFQGLGANKNGFPILHGSLAWAWQTGFQIPEDSISSFFEKLDQLTDLW
ncbi:hypothetical protein F4677DRAFT_413831 [Hypoxylon crocopeplum]|nr:hypothetical protein F4677DRAFT_413831 [Hypoxylon crocopeplum]